MALNTDKKSKMNPEACMNGIEKNLSDCKAGKLSQAQTAATLEQIIKDLEKVKGRG